MQPFLIICARHQLNNEYKNVSDSITMILCEQRISLKFRITDIWQEDAKQLLHPVGRLNIITPAKVVAAH